MNIKAELTVEIKCSGNIRELAKEVKKMFRSLKPKIAYIDEACCGYWNVTYSLDIARYDLPLVDSIDVDGNELLADIAARLEQDFYIRRIVLNIFPEEEEYTYHTA